MRELQLDEDYYGNKKKVIHGSAFKYNKKTPVGKVSPLNYTPNDMNTDLGYLNESGVPSSPYDKTEGRINRSSSNQAVP